LKQIAFVGQLVSHGRNQGKRSVIPFIRMFLADDPAENKTGHGTMSHKD